MKTAFMLFAMLLGANAFAADAKIQSITMICNLADISKEDPNIQTKTYNVELGKTIQIATYNSHLYQVSAFDVSYGDHSRYELSLSARDAKTNAVIGSSAATFSIEIPDVNYQDTANILLNCMQKGS